LSSVPIGHAQQDFAVVDDTIEECRSKF